jgi:urease subunit gamma
LIHIKIIVHGEPDTSPFKRIFDNPKIDEEIFNNSVILIKEKLKKNLKININEVLDFYSEFIVSELRDGKSVEQIQNNISNLLDANDVMIGVPETLREIFFEINLDNSTKNIVLNTPIQILNYVLNSEIKGQNHD